MLQPFRGAFLQTNDISIDFFKHFLQPGRTESNAVIAKMIGTPDVKTDYI
jgi:hypothetical protein